MMQIATHLIKVKGKWRRNKKELREYVREKVKEIDNYFSPDIELIKLEGNIAEVWVYISAMHHKIEWVEEDVRKWLYNHIHSHEIMSVEVEEQEAHKALKEGKEPRFAILIRRDMSE